MQRHRSISLSLGRLAFIQSHRSSDPREVLRGERPKRVFPRFLSAQKSGPAERTCQAGKCAQETWWKVRLPRQQKIPKPQPQLRDHVLLSYTCAMNLRNCSLPSAVRLYTPACSNTWANTRPVSYWTMSQALSWVMDSYLVLKPSAQSACLAVVS